LNPILEFRGFRIDLEVSMRLLPLGIVAVFVLVLSAGSAWAWGNASNCVGCHTTLNPNNDDGALHTAHNTFINDCGWCHGSSGFTPVRTNESENDSENSCTGCHTLGGLYAIHGGAANCSPCHSADPPLPGMESDVPPYYGNPAATTLEAWNVCFDGLDNDGDGVRDGNDPDCATVPTEWESWSAIKTHYGK
jgi:hypothetical protein